MKKLLVMISSFILLFLVPISVSHANSVDVTKIKVGVSTTEEVDKAVMKYIELSDNKYPRFNFSKALDDGASADLLQIGEVINVLHENEISSASKLQTRVGAFKVWGKYCGPKHSGPGKPIDILDAACKRHDDCYAKRGYLKCSCDQILINEINRDLPRMSKLAKTHAYAIKTYMLAQKAWCKK